MAVPKISESTKEEREEYIKEKYKCKSDCDNCGICKVLRGKTPEVFFEEFIAGEKELRDIKLY